MNKTSSEVVVIGGSPTGISAAIAAEEAWSKALLIEKNGFLGGTPVSGRPGAFCGFYTSEPKPNQIVKGIADKMLEYMKKEDAIYGPVNVNGMIVLFYDLPVLKMVVDKMVTDSGIDILMHSQLVESKVKDGMITSVKVASKSGMIKIEGKMFIDATGDADLAYLSGVKCVKSKELQPGSIMYRLGNVDMEKSRAFVRSGKLEEAINRANSSGEFYISRHDGLILPTPRPNEAVIGFSHIPVDATDTLSLTKAELKAHVEVNESFRLLKNRVPGFENSYILDMASSVGIRETRRLAGQYVLREEDVLTAAKFDDGICRCAWPIELHTKESTQLRFLKAGEWYDIPFRCCLPKEIHNLLVAGRSISCDGQAQASCRVVAPSMAVGQACGTACAISVKRKAGLKELDIMHLKEALRNQGAYV